MRWPWPGWARDRAELQRLRRSEARYRLLADETPDLIIQIDLGGRIEYASPAAKTFDLSPQLLEGRSILEFIHPDDHAGSLERIRRLASGGETASGEDNEFRIRRGDGEWAWVQGNPRLVRDAEARPTAILTMLRDVTEKKALESQLSESEQRHRLITETAADMILRIGMDDIIEFASPAARIFGYGQEDLVGRRSRAFIHPEDADGRTSKALMAGRPLPKGAANQFRLRRPDGSYAWAQSSPAPILDGAGKTVGVINVVRDVSQQVALEEELRRKRSEAEAAAVAKSEFLANMSHEIRTPLTAVVGFAGLMAKLPGLPAQALTYLDRIARSGEALAMIVNNVLDFSKIEAGEVELSPHPFDLGELVEETLEVVRAGAAAKALKLVWSPAPGAPTRLEADAGRLRQVLLNLLTNAVKFTREGEVTVAARHAGGVLHVTVSDTGIGVPADQAHRLFQRFSQIDASNTRAFGGTGLGLAISKGLVELLGGEIGYAPRSCGGSEFWFTVRAAAVMAPEDEPASEGSPAELRRFRVLVVDDAPLNRELILALLSPFHLDVSEAADGAEAVAAAQAEAFDLILMDLQMPGMDGISATEVIRAAGGPNRETPIIAVSASVQPADVEACRRAGMNDHVPKPISSRELLTKIARWTNPGAEAA